MTRPVRLSPSAAITPTGAGVILRSDLGTFEVAGADTAVFVDRVVPLLDGSLDREAIAARLPGYSRVSVGAFLRLLEDHGLIEEVPAVPARGRGQEAFLRAWPDAPRDASARIAGARVICVGRGSWGAAAATALGGAGLSEVRVAEDVAAIAGEPWSLVLAAVPHDDPDALERLSRLAHRMDLVSLWSCLAGTKAVIGPLVTPGITACRICATDDGLNPVIGGRPAGAAARLLGHLVAMEAIRVISGYAPSTLGGRVLIEDLATLETSLHTLVRLPWCRVCG